MHPKTRRSAGDVFDNIDKDGSGELDLCEFRIYSLLKCGCTACCVATGKAGGMVWYGVWFGAMV